jgi:prepilin-type N-terminal cleavage/methylation domain-containing protein
VVAHTSVSLRRHSNGFTLIELLVVSALIATFLIALPPLVKSTIGFLTGSIRQTVSLREGRDALEQITLGIHSAKNGTLSIDSLATQPPFSRITFQTVQLTTTTYWQENNILWMDTGSGPRKLTTSLDRFLVNFPDQSSTKKLDVYLSTEYSLISGGKKKHEFLNAGLEVYN